MPRGRPRKEFEASRQNEGESISKMEGVRRALAKLGIDAKPLVIKAFLKEQFDIDMEPNMISNYKSTLKSTGKSAIIQQPRANVGGGKVGAFSLDEIQAVKEVADRIGADKLRKLAEVLTT
ncbi:MAG TPA: hypothetical protein VK395_01420 [Gemmataceae bacterium]|nr:hypothetical protein [Gemmataceae bacterium]